MATIEIRKAYTMDSEHLKAELDDLAARLGDHFSLECCWQSDSCLDFKRSGADGQINIDNEEVAIDINLGFLLQAFKGKIEQEIQDFVDTHIY